MRNLVWSAGFVGKFKRLIKKNPQLRSQFEKVLQLLTEDPFDSSLLTHKLKGGLDEIWSCSIDYDNRILFEFVANSDSGEEDIILLIFHDSYFLTQRNAKVYAKVRRELTTLRTFALPSARLCVLILMFNCTFMPLT